MKTFLSSILCFSFILSSSHASAMTCSEQYAKSLPYDDVRETVKKDLMYSVGAVVTVVLTGGVVFLALSKGKLATLPIAAVAAVGGLGGSVASKIVFDRYSKSTSAEKFLTELENLSDAAFINDFSSPYLQKHMTNLKQAASSVLPKSARIDEEVLKKSFFKTIYEEPTLCANMDRDSLLVNLYNATFERYSRAKEKQSRETEE